MAWVPLQVVWSRAADAQLAKMHPLVIEEIEAAVETFARAGIGLRVISPPFDVLCVRQRRVLLAFEGVEGRESLVVLHLK